ncbi:MAG: Asp-tRNA(Asn)/Glu-tRNA(Gln) amidotransferase GatCAB subunit A, partial [Cyanobacteria bacterium REEB65]|nr:Asp-tRNA(Asn)/Glu-tRNA(Gln) amidotransferase GatCAB subunit A [Cyanobacteria bacterium REEB65]
MSSPAFLPVHELAPMIQRRELSPVEVTRTIVERIQRLEPRLNTFITFKPDEAMQQARRAEEEIVRGEYRGPFHGVPLAIKDNIAVAGWPTTNGSSLMADHVSDYDATVVEKLRAAGAIIVGKNNMHEWAMGVACTNGWFGAVHNPWDEKRVPGGSSGGSAAAVSASLIYGSVGTDFKGSVRIPGSFCGVVGFKPTQGLVSRFGQLPPTSSNFDHLGPIVKDVTDAALMLNVIAGHDPRDPTSVAFPNRDFTALLERGIAGLRVGVPKNFFFQRSSEEVEAVVRAAIGTLGELGADVQEVSIPS